MDNLSYQKWNFLHSNRKLEKNSLNNNAWPGLEISEKKLIKAKKKKKLVS